MTIVCLAATLILIYLHQVMAAGGDGRTGNSDENVNNGI